MKNFLFAVVLLIGGSLWAELPRLGLADFSSSTMEKGKLALLTEAFRTELFRTNLFVLVDQPWSPGTKSANIDVGASGSVEAFGKTWVVGLRVVDLGTGTVAFSETATVNDEAQVFRAIKELSSRLAARVRFGLVTAKNMEAEWKALGATGGVLTGLTGLNESTADYLSLRQYDGTISPEAYLDLRRKNVDLDLLRSYLENGLAYRDSLRALDMGITRLDKYLASFKPAGFEFGEYLDAYGLGLSTVGEYKRYLADSQRDYFSFGVGGVADKLPLGSTDFKFLLGQAAWEHSWKQNQLTWYRVNTEGGFFLLGLLLPTPYVAINLMAGSAPFYVKAGIGGHAELLVGGHAAINFRLGVEVGSQFEATLFAVPLGTQPSINYAGGFTKWKGGPDGPIAFPYYGLLFTYKMPIVTRAP